MKRLIVRCFLVWSIAYQVDADTNGTILVNGVERKFVYAVSAYPAPATGRPLVIHLHGDGGNMGLSAAWKQAVLNDANGAVLLSAQGRNNIPAAAIEMTRHGVFAWMKRVRPTMMLILFLRSG